MLFWKSLAAGRSPRTFRNSLKNSRDGFDGWVDSGRRGWRDSRGDPRGFSDVEQWVWQKWASAERQEFWAGIREYAQFSVLQIPPQELDDADFVLGGDDQVQARTEGGVRYSLRVEFERDPVLRSQAIAIHGLDCMACGFNFERVYGADGAGFVEVHHAAPLSLARQRETDPRQDLVVLCANCHRVVHRRWSRVLSLEELRAKIKARVRP